MTGNSVLGGLASAATEAASASSVLGSGLNASAVLTTASLQGFQTISAASVATSLAESDILTSELSPQTLATSALFSNATAALTPLSGADGVATATAGAGVVGGALQPLPGSAAATGSLRPLNGVGAGGSAASATELVSNAANAAATATEAVTSLKPLGGGSTESVASLQPLSSIASTTFFQSGRAGASGTVTGGLNGAASSAVVTAGAASTVLPWTMTGAVAGLVAYLLL